MTKKHYEAIAAIIKNRGVKCCGNTGVLAGLYATSLDLADFFATDNKNFDRARFLEACGIKQTCLTCNGTGQLGRGEKCLNCNN